MPWQDISQWEKTLHEQFFLSLAKTLLNRGKMKKGVKVKNKYSDATAMHIKQDLDPLLLTWFNFNPSVDK